ncbi:MAG: PqqD family protein [Deltaproteobacteria bacterium]|nr:PqqD family protein [Deltaproteobacteria bacterium]
MNSITPESVVSRKMEIVAGMIDDEMVMANIDSGNYHRLNPTAARIWELLDQPRSVAAICEILTSDFRVSPEVCRTEVINFLDELASRKIIVIA